MAGRWLVLLTCLGALALSASARADGDANCGIYPAAINAGTYGGWSACKMKAHGHKPLWQGLPAGTPQIIRFVFTDGHGMFYRVVTITEQADGTAMLEVAGTRRRKGIKPPERRIPVRRRSLTRDEVTRISALGDQTGTWNFETGSWDGDEMYIHCQVLEMERANAAGYRYSSVNIGCNKPQKLMPLVDEIARLAGLETAFNGMLYY